MNRNASDSGLLPAEGHDAGRDMLLQAWPGLRPADRYALAIIADTLSKHPTGGKSKPSILFKAFGLALAALDFSRHRKTTAKQRAEPVRQDAGSGATDNEQGGNKTRATTTETTGASSPEATRPEPEAEVADALENGIARAALWPSQRIKSRTSTRRANR